MAVTGTDPNLQDLWGVDTTILNRAARRIAETKTTMEIESMILLADLRGRANIFDRILRVIGTAAQQEAQRIVRH